MSQATQIEFVRLVDSYYQHYQNALRLGRPSFRNDGFISTATMSGSGGLVEIRCGPAEYHAEIFVTTLKEQKRWSLADLMTIERVRNWMLENRPNTSRESRLEAEIECAFSLLTDGLKGVANFEWLH
jgi:hypothetical protein